MSRILFLPGIVEQTIGGAELQARYIAEALSVRKYDITGIYIFPTNIATPIYPGFLIRKKEVFHRFGADFIYLGIMQKYIRMLRPDIIYVRSYMPYSLYSAVKYSRDNHCKVIWHVASDHLLYKPLAPFPKPLFIQILDNALLRKAIQSVDYIICQTERQASLLRKNYSRQPDQVVPNFHPRPTEPIRKKETVQVVWISHFKRLKQPELFIDLAESLKSFRNVKFIMIGCATGGRWVKSVVRRILETPNVVWLGGLPLSNVNSILAESHLLVNTSIYEGFPNVFIQAWMRKVPVISLHVDIDDTIKNTPVGYVCHTFDKLLERTLYLIKNDAVRDAMAEHAQILCEKFSYETNIPKIIKAFML
ncbi:MAG: glycosyltransferase family 4 protein [Desulfosoma sp.]